MEKFKNYRIILTIWRIVDSHWRCISRRYSDNNESLPLFDGTLADYLSHIGFDVPETIRYCLASNGNYSIKFRLCGGSIYIYVKPLNYN